MLGIVCGFESEARVARLFTPLVACSGALENVARAGAERLVQQGATTLLSFGVAGGLSPNLTPKNLVIGNRVTDADGRSWRCDEKLVEVLATALPQAKKGGVFGSKVLIPSPQQKHPLFDRTGCLIVDMESQAVAEVASRHPIRFAVLRGLSDTVDESFPPAALAGIKPDGSMNLGGILLSLLKQPGQFPALMRLGKNTKLALKNLRDAVPQVQPLLSQY
ncbi:MAG TPA: hypothetical protein VHB73_03545 [Alphaproteobacteria bacterium]|nr:hypothetical protein [Alphaproteobacteria bacterium]